MQKSYDKMNIFVFGDLVLDYSIEVETKKRPYQPAEGEKVYQAVRRLYDAGGAANCARVLAALEAGKVWLWGLTGHSPYGKFTEILKSCHAVDGAHKKVLFLGINNESRQMNTVERILLLKDESKELHRESRIDDIDYVPLVDTDALVALNHLENMHSSSGGISAIIINDLDMDALTPVLIENVANFAATKKVPLFIDPKREWKKYKSITATCVLPNLEEWCYIVNEKEPHDKWRHGLDDPNTLKDMAIRSLRYMPNIKYHVIKCDRDGAVIILPVKLGEYCICHIPPHPASGTVLPNQIGTGDVLTAVLALEYASKRNNNEFEHFLESFRVANKVVACYRQMSWHRMPNLMEVERMNTLSPEITTTTEVASGILYLPSSDSISMKDVSTAIPGLVSVNESYKNTINELLTFFTDGWDSSNVRSAILTARGGVGKSTIKDGLIEALKEKCVCVRDFKNEAINSKNINAAHETITNIWLELPKDIKGLLLILDEAFSIAPQLLFDAHGKMLLQVDNEPGRRTRFLFIDADYEKHKNNLSISQFVSRCTIFKLPPIGQRLYDIPYIFANACFKKLLKQNVSSIKISEAVLVAVINCIITLDEREQSPRKIVDEADAMINNAARTGSAGIITLSRRYLTKTLKDHDVLKGVEKKLFEFKA